jgi:ribosomal protein L4
MSSKDVNVYDLLRHAGLLLSEGAAKKLSEALAK